MALSSRPEGWSIEKTEALNALLDTAHAYMVLDRVLTAANDGSAAGNQLRADLVALAKRQLVTLKQL